MTRTSEVVCSIVIRSRDPLAESFTYCTVAIAYIPRYTNHEYALPIVVR